MIFWTLNQSRVRQGGITIVEREYKFDETNVHYHASMVADPPDHVLRRRLNDYSYDVKLIEANVIKCNGLLLAEILNVDFDVLKRYFVTLLDWKKGDDLYLVNDGDKVKVYFMAGPAASDKGVSQKRLQEMLVKTESDLLSKIAVKEEKTEKGIYAGCDLTKELCEEVLERNRLREQLLVQEGRDLKEIDAILQVVKQEVDNLRNKSLPGILGLIDGKKDKADTIDALREAIATDESKKEFIHEYRKKDLYGDTVAFTKALLKHKWQWKPLSTNTNNVDSRVKNFQYSLQDTLQIRRYGTFKSTDKDANVIETSRNVWQKLGLGAPTP